MLALSEADRGVLRTAPAVLAYVAKKEGVSVDDLKGPSKLRTVVYPRFRAMHMLRQLKRGGEPMSYPAIGGVLGGRDHTTIMNGIQRAEELGLTEELH